MKVDRFVKVLLIIIALLLAINCISSNRTPLTGGLAEAAAPSFFQVGKVYRIDTNNDVKVLKIDNSGWIYIESRSTGTGWLNTNQVKYVSEH